MTQFQAKITNEELNSKYFEVGYIKDAHSLKGEVFVRLYSGKADWLSSVTSFLLVSRNSGIETDKFKDSDGSASQHTQIETLERKFTGTRKHKDGLIVKLETINDRNASEALKGSKVFIPKESLVAPAGDSIYLNELTNFEVIDQSGVSIGTIVEFASNGLQDILVIKNKDSQEVLVPLIHQFITEMNLAGKKIHMNLPEGLIEVNFK
jgi:16S rRNA processing protein RimM